MFEQKGAATSTAPDLDTAAAVLDFARDRRAAANTAEADLIQAAVAWADLHPAESIHDATLLSRYGNQPFAVAGPGARAPAPADLGTREVR